MERTRPTVNIDLEEYNELLELKKEKSKELNYDEAYSELIDYITKFFINSPHRHNVSSMKEITYLYMSTQQKYVVDFHSTDGDNFLNKSNFKIKFSDGYTD